MRWLVLVCLAVVASCGPTIQRDLPVDQARGALQRLIAAGAAACTDESIVQLRSALASFAVHMDDAKRTWPHPDKYRLAPRLNGEKIAARPVDDTDLWAVLAVREGLAPVSDFASLSQQMLKLTWTYHTPDIDRAPFGDYPEKVRMQTCDAFLTMVRARFAVERVHAANALRQEGSRGSPSDARFTAVREAECALSQALTAAGAAAEPCKDRSWDTRMREERERRGL